MTAASAGGHSPYTRTGGSPQFVGVPRFVFFVLTLPFLVSGSNAASAPATSIVIGFVGGYVHNNNALHEEVKLAAHLRDDRPSGMQARIFKNHEGRQAHEAVLEMLGAKPDGAPSDQEKRAAHIVLYGHSWGASEAVTLARSLQKDGVPVLLTVQVDSVSKFGEDDRFIPPNVAQAVNFYQLNGLLHGQRRIVAMDRLRTEILGNFRLDYTTKHVNTNGYPWFARTFMRPHIEIESDPSVWNRVESLILAKLQPATAKLQ